MAIENSRVVFHYKTQEDLSDSRAGVGHIYKAFNVSSGVIASRGEDATGLLVQTAANNSNVAILVSGVGKYTSAGGQSINDQLTVTGSGYFSVAGSGDTIVGKALFNSTSGSVGVGLFDFSNLSAFDSSSGHASLYDLYELVVSADLTAGALFTVSDSGDFAEDAAKALGVLQSNTASGGTGILRVSGILDAVAGDVITRGNLLTVSSGFVIEASSGDMAIGTALDTSLAANSGSSFRANFNFATPHFITNSNDLRL